MGGVEYFLGIQIKQENCKFSINQQKFIDKIVNEYDLREGKLSEILLYSGYEKN